MDKTKAAIQNFVSKAGHHDTTVHEQVAPKVTHEIVKPARHEEVNTAIDKEVHQDHYHHTVQPIHDREVLPEQHKHNVRSVEHREFDHRDHDQTKHALSAEAGKIHDKRVVHDTTHTQTHAPVSQGEHVHHHVHETVQPVIHKEVVQPSVVHTTVPIHEVHHNAAKHHTTSELPPVTMDEFKKHGGSLNQQERTHAFDGCPEGGHDEGKNLSGTHGTSHTSHTGNNTGHTGSAVSGGAVSHDHRDVAAGKQSKPSLLDKLNPMKDTDRDGKKGIMD